MNRDAIWWFLGLFAVLVVGIQIYIRMATRAPAPEPEDDRPRKKKKKKKKPSAKLEVEDDDGGEGEKLARLMEAMANDTKRPRGKHYGFAHGVLRSLVRTKGGEVFSLLRDGADDGSAEHALTKVWNDMEADPAEGYPHPPRVSAIEGGVLVRMPPPEATTEAYMIAIVEQGDGVRYFTLEKSLLNAVLCEWTDDAHINLGPCAATDEAFVATLRKKLT